MLILSSSLHFVKMHATGNDYVYIDNRKGCQLDYKNLAVRVACRHKGIGSDGLIVICNSNVAHAKMLIFNADGSQGETCGNGLRCVASYLYRRHIVNALSFCIETIAGIVSVNIDCHNPDFDIVSVNMGTAKLDCSAVPFVFDKQTCVNEQVALLDSSFSLTVLSMGNPHAVLFCQNVQNFPLQLACQQLLEQFDFPNGVNLEIVSANCQGGFDVRIFERGSGETLSCGSGACAVGVALVLSGKAKFGQLLNLQVPGGELEVVVTSDGVILRGQAVEVFEGCLKM